MKKPLSVFLIFSVLLSFTACCRRQTGAVDAGADAPLAFLFAGLDEAAENTDVLLLLSIDPSKNRIAVMQIPRDTYFRADASVDKINGIYAASRCRGDSAQRALSVLSSLVSEAFSVSLAGSVAFTAAALRAAVDAMGGVTVTLPENMEIEGRHYGAGAHLLMGAEAEAFVRYREGYAMGDLGRVDAQKIFLAAFLRSARTQLRPAALIQMLFSMREDLVTDIPISRALSLGLWVHARLSSLSAVFFTLPGEPLLYHGHWYYIANRVSGTQLLSEYFPFGFAFDPSERLCDSADLAQANIYNDSHYPYLVYTEEKLSSMKIQTKKE